MAVGMACPPEKIVNFWLWQEKQDRGTARGCAGDMCPSRTVVRRAHTGTGARYVRKSFEFLLNHKNSSRAPEGAARNVPLVQASSVVVRYNPAHVRICRLENPWS